MSPIIYEPDPDYDTVIVLKNPCKDFAPWDPTADIPEPAKSVLPSEPGAELVVKVDDDDNGRYQLMTTKKSKKKGQKGKKLPLWASENDDALIEWEDPDAVARGSSPGGEAGPIDTEPSYSAGHVLSSEDVDLAESRIHLADLEAEVIHYHVSSRHLTLASPWFKRTLTSSSSEEAVRNPADGRFYVNASDWDKDAFLILLNIFHLRKRQIPKIVSLEMLAKIAVLVNYYELEKVEAIEDHVENWIEWVRRNCAVPKTYCRELVLWMCISSVFDLSVEFEKATAVAIQESTGSIQTLSLPIPLRATRDIDCKRVHAIECIISELHRLLEKYCSTDYSCPHGSHSFFCGAFLLGVLQKEMKRWGFLAPRLENPFLGSSLKGVCSKIGAVRSPIWYHKNNYPFSSSLLVNHPCSLKGEIDSIVQDSTKIFGGLKLSDLKGGQ